MQGFAFARGPILLSGAGFTTPGAVAPSTGPSTKRVGGLSAMDALWAQKQAEKLFGPFNPRSIPDRVLKWMTSDWTIGFCQEIWLSGFGSVDYFLEGGSAEIRAFLEEAMMDRLAQWREVLLRALPYGRQTCEIVWGVEDVPYTFTDDPETGAVDRTRAAAYTPGDLRDLDPEMCQPLEDPATGDLVGVRYGGVDLPRERLIHVVNEPEFGSHFGRPLNQRAYIPWWRCNYDYLLVDRYLEKKGDPPTIGFAPTEERTDAQGRAQDPVKIMGVGLANIRSGSSYVLPNEFDPESKQPLWAVKTLEVAQRAPEFLAVIDRHEQNKRLAWLIPGQLGAGGSFASDKIAQQIVDRMFDRRLEALILAPINRTLLPQIVMLNFPGAKKKDVPRLCAGSMSSEARAQFVELVKQAINLDTVLPDGRVAKVCHLIDMTRGLRKVGIARTDPALIPDAPDPIDVGDAPASGTLPVGRPSRIAPEPNRPAAPSRPGQSGLSRRRAVAFSLPAPDSWVSGVVSGLAQIDDAVFKAAKLVESERLSVEAEIKNLAKKAIARAKTSDGAIAAHNRTLAADLERDVRAMLEKSLHEDLLDVGDIDARTLGFAKVSPLATQHGKAFQAAAATLNAAGVSSPGKAAAVRIVKDVARGAATNGQGVVVRETRRIVETVDTLVIDEVPIETADAKVDTYEMPARDLQASTEQHVRATARATLSWSGAQAEADSWLVAAGPSSEATVLDHFPRGQVADQLWTVRSTDDLHTQFREIMVDQKRPATTWRGLGLNFGSPEMYVPIPKGNDALIAGILAIAAERRRAWNEARAARQAEIDQQNADRATTSGAPGT